MRLFLPPLFSPIKVSGKLHRHCREFILFSLPLAVMKLNQNVRINTKRDHVALLCSFVICQIGQGVPLVVVLHCCVMFAGARRTVRMSLWAMGEGKTMITCTGSTCPACTAVAAATAARPPSLLPPTPSATHLSLSTCKSPLLQTTVNLNTIRTKWKAEVVDNLFSQPSLGCAQCGWY